MDTSILKPLPLIGLVLGLSFLVGCDSGNPEDETDEELSNITQRGLSLSEAQSNPTGTPGFPYRLESGETITFTPILTEVGAFLEEIPLGTFNTESSTYLRQGATSGSIYFPVKEDTFRYLYSTSIGEGTDDGAVSTQTSAVIQYAFEHEFTRLTDFIPRMEAIQNNSSIAQSLDDAINGGGNVTSRDNTIIDAISTAGIAATLLSEVLVGDTYVIGSPGAVRRTRTISLYNIDSTNANLDSNNPVITGQYTVLDEWQQITFLESNDKDYLDLYHDVRTGADIIENEIEEGTFIIRLNELD
ncbi:hypothetical protein [Rubritalea sp.]|uniref:hypothetical protein n=1 Tax=Rubritalea sp. TaxID=2109375 RepID=UPI003EF7E1A5